MVNFKCLHDNILIDSFEDSSAGDLIVADDNKKILTGKVVAVGLGRWESYGIIPSTLRIGDIVYFSSFSEQKIRIKGKIYSIVPEKELLGYSRENSSNN